MAGSWQFSVRSIWLCNSSDKTQ